MNRKDIATIRRRFSPDKHDISVIRGCYVNEKGEIVSTFSKSPISLPESEAAQYLNTFKKTLGGAAGRNQFTLAVRPDEPSGKLLRDLQASALTDDGAVERLCRTIIDNLEAEGSYLILMMHDACALPYKKADEHAERPDFDDRLFNYIMVCVCPVKLTKPLLTFFSDDRDFHTVEPDLAVAGPALGFMYPVLCDGGADVNAALYYTRDAGDIHADFGTEAPASSADTREAFYGVLGDSLEEGLTYDVVQTLHENMVQQLADRKKDAAPLQISRKEIASLLNSCDVDRAQQEKFDDLYLEQFGAVGMEAALIADQKKYEIAAENVTVSVAPDRSDLVTMKRVDGRRVIVIAVEGDVTVNGVEVVIP